METLDISPDYAHIQYHIGLSHSAPRERENTMKALKKVLSMQPGWREFIEGAAVCRWLDQEAGFMEMIGE